jgi:hypothetical protein
MPRVKAIFRRSVFALGLGKRLVPVLSVLVFLWLAVYWAVSLP